MLNWFDWFYWFG